ncbi:MAG: cyclase family protein [Planctomycetes bacterium]|nr:cyclase family protein [Planctomycetota bacterium]
MEVRIVLYDISAPISSDLHVWPGDHAFRREITFDLSAGDPVTASAIRTTVHIGTHADALAHVVPGGAPIDQMPLDAYLGRCQVNRVDVARATAIRLADLTEPICTPRVLLATGTFPDPTRFNEDFAAMSVELADALHAAGARLVGIDTPGVDLFTATELPVHHRLAEHGIASIEGLRLDHVPPGEYELIALPLRLAGCDASPVRAVLRSVPA